MTLGRTDKNKIKIKVEDGTTRAVNCACCNTCGCYWDPTWMTESDPDFTKKLLGTDPNIPKFTQVTASASGTIHINRSGEDKSFSVVSEQLSFTAGSFNDLHWVSGDGQLELIALITEDGCIYITLIEFYTNEFIAVSVAECEPQPADPELGICAFDVAGFPASINGVSLSTMKDVCESGYWVSAQIDITFS